MKRHILLTVLLSLFSIVSFAQDPGDVIYGMSLAQVVNPSGQTSFSYNTTNMPNNFFRNGPNQEYGYFTKDKFFVISPQTDFILTVVNNNQMNTHIWLFTYCNGINMITHGDGGNGITATLTAYQLYYIVVEGLYSNGQINTNFTFTTVGDKMATPYNAGSFAQNFSYSNIRDSYLFTDQYTYQYKPNTNDIYYKFTLTNNMVVTLTHEGSTLNDTYMFLLNSSGGLIDRNDDYYGEGHCTNDHHSYIKRSLSAGTYYVVSEGYSANGRIKTNISGIVCPTGDSFSNSINAGSYSSQFTYTNTVNTNLYSNQYSGQITNDVYHKFVLNTPMNVTLTHEGSKLGDTRMYLLNSNGGLIEENNNYSGGGQCSDTLHSFIQRQLNAGTYYVVSEGNSEEGVIKINITANTPSYGYPAIPSTYSTQSNSVGSMGGSFAVSPMGGATYSIPIEVPMGVGGLKPSIGIVYNSQSGYGLCGYGATISGMSAITRGTKSIYYDGTTKGMDYLADDALYLDGVRLIMISGTPGQEGATYALESDPFTKVIAYGTCSQTSDDTYYKLIQSDGTEALYGCSGSSRQAYNDTINHRQKIRAWYVDRITQPTGNFMDYYYNVINNYTYLYLIAYGTNTGNLTGNHLSNQVEFTYETSDGKPIYFDNKSGSLSQRLKYITCSTNDNTFRKYTLTYDNTTDKTNYKYSRLISVTESNGNEETLPATQFNWSFLPALDYSAVNLAVNAPSAPNGVSLPFGDQIYVSGDLNNDGLDDIVGLTPKVNVNGSNKSFLNIYWAQRSGNSVSYTTSRLFEMSQQFNKSLFIQRERGDFHSFFNGSAIVDWDGNGYNEVMLPYYETITGQNYLSFYVQGCNASGESCWNVPVRCQLNTSNGAYYAIADLNNDGRDDIVILEKSMYSGYYTCHLLSYDPTYANYYRGVNIQLSLPSAPKKVCLSDLNGNGVKDLLVICNNNYAVYWNQGGESINSSMFSDMNKKTSADLKYQHLTNFGDFNGDGLLDILTKHNIFEGTEYYFYFSKGDGSFTRTLACNLSLYEQSLPADDDKFHCDVFDFDGDGRSDVVVTKAMYRYDEFQKTYTYWMRSTGTSLEQVYSATSNNQNDALTNRYVVGDFNGDGLEELATYGYNCLNGTNANSSPVWRRFKHNSYSPNSGKVVSIVGDNGATTSITYSTLADQTVYSIGGNDAYPAPRYTKPMNVVASTTQSNGAAGDYTTNYQYTGLKIHLKGKGALGFYSIRMNNTTMGSVVKSENLNWNNYYAPVTTKVIKTIGGLSSQIVTTSTFVDKGGKLFFTYPSQTVETDFDGKTVTTNFTYDTSDTLCGNILNKTVTYGANMYVSESYSDYILAGNRYQPQTVTETKRHPDDNAPFSRITKFTYNSETGTVSTKIENFQNTTKRLTTQLTYDLYGNVISQVTTGTGVSACTRYISYDETRRFPVRIYTNPSSSVKKYTYNIWGNVLTERDSINSGINNKITNTYDAWGNKIRTQKQGNGEKSYTSGWGGNPGMSYFVLEQGTSSPWVKTWYDNQGREVKIETVGPMNVPVSTIISYNEKGLKTKVTENRGNLSISHYTTYDDRGRVHTERRSGESDKIYSYSYDSDKRYTTISDNGRQTTYAYDLMGNLKEVNSPSSSTLKHWYSSNGNIRKTVADGVTWTFGFDNCGNRTSMSDPDAGNNTYAYDALGREILHTDGRGYSYATYYDYLGRVTYDGTTTFTYGTSGNGQTRLVSESNGWWIKNYTYDTYGHVIQESMVKYAVSIKTMGYHYNANGLLTQKDYPNQKSISYSYDSYGNCTNINAQNGLIVWNLVGYNGETTTSSIKIGDATPYIRTTQLDNYGYWQSRVMTLGNTTIQNDQYVFNPLTGNLTSRTLTGHPTESFTYDNLDRLTGASGAESVVVEYATNGNYTKKTNVGDYYYPSGNTHAHAVDHIDVNPNTDDVPDFDQYMEYDYRNKADCIATNVGDNYYWYTMEYGPDHQCAKSYLSINDDPVLEKFFWDEYEEINGIACLHWIEAPDGLVGLIINESYGEYTDIYVYVAMTDHLGSLTGLLEYDGTFDFEAYYDAWGKRTISNNYLGTPIGFRGYTGHEQIDEIGLVNMKGRMYDPLQGRFLSPDPYIQDPTNPQSFNRYSYCLNNPLKYTDPSGNFFATIYGFLSDMIDNVCRTFQGRSWKWTKTKNGLEIDKAWITVDPNQGSAGKNLWELISRFTWQLPQTFLGYKAAVLFNTTGHVEQVTHGYGATVMATDFLDKGTGFSLGCFIHGDDQMTASVDNPVFRHEYGHYLQSRDWGLLYVPKFALPSWWNAKDSGFGKQHNFYTEVDANKRAFRYFNKYENDYWKSNNWNFENYPISIDDKYNKAQSDGPWDTGLTRFKWYDVFVPFDFLGIAGYEIYTLSNYSK